MPVAKMENVGGSAGRWGSLWGARPDDWAESEELQRPTYEAALARLEFGAGARVLDIGCGAGVFLRMAADREAVPFGLDASEALLERASERVPQAELTVGEMESLPYPDGSFDAVTGFNSFFFATDMVAALAEAGRVAAPGAPIVIQVWGAPERCDLEAMKRVARSYAPPPPPNAPPPPRLWEGDVLAGIARRAGLIPGDEFEISYGMLYPDSATLAQRMLAPMGLAALAGPEREEQVKAEIVEALAPFRGDDGAYRLKNAYRFLIARA